jgi:hypothetical protein
MRRLLGLVKPRVFVDSTVSAPANEEKEEIWEEKSGGCKEVA